MTEPTTAPENEKCPSGKLRLFIWFISTFLLANISTVIAFQIYPASQTIGIGFLASTIGAVVCTLVASFEDGFVSNVVYSAFLIFICAVQTVTATHRFVASEPASLATKIVAAASVKKYSSSRETDVVKTQAPAYVKRAISDHFNRKIDAVELFAFSKMSRFEKATRTKIVAACAKAGGQSVSVRVKLDPVKKTATILKFNAPAFFCADAMSKH